MATLLKDPHDIVGRHFGRLTVTKFLRSAWFVYSGGRRRARRYYYRCSCACGGKKTAMRQDLLSRHTKSCGCGWKPKASENWKWTGHGELSGVLWSKIRNHARYRKLPFDITIEDAWRQFLNQNRRCAMTGCLLVFGTSTGEENTGTRTASLDRVNSKKGYIRSNIQWVHKDINLMKMDLSVNRFIELCGLVVAYRKAA